jgi:hypothetical protein
LTDVAAPHESAFDELVSALADSAAFVRSHPFYADDENQASGYAFLVSMLLSRLEERVVFDTDQPYFRILDPRIREGGDNPDQRYLIARLVGGETYRIWGTLGTARRLDVQIYAGDPYIAGSGGRSASFLNFEQIEFADDGSFEIVASPDAPDGNDGPASGNWLENPADATRILVRQIFSDWEHELPGEVHIDRIGREGDLKPPLTAGALAERLEAAAVELRQHVEVWPEMVRNGYLRAPNTLFPPMDPSTLGGVAGRWMSGGSWDLADGEALVVRTWPADGNYQGIQLADVWFSSLEYANRQTSLSADQAHRSADGSYWFVVAGSDPGVANWLDTTGRRRGAILLRYDGTTDPVFDPAKHPTAVKVDLADLDAHLPADMVRISPEQRAEQIAIRRRHVQRRFGN